MKNCFPEGFSFGDFYSRYTKLVPTKEGRPFVTDIQYLALQAGVTDGKRLLVRSPKGSGKGLIGWWAASRCFQHDKMVLYLTSSEDAARQRFEDASDIFFGENWVTSRGSDPTKSKMIVTEYEGFLWALDQTNGGANIGLIICDDLDFIIKPEASLSLGLMPAIAKATRKFDIQLVGLTSTLMPRRFLELYADAMDLNLVCSEEHEYFEHNMAA